MVAGARDCVRSGTIGMVRVLGLRELSPAPFFSFPGFPFPAPPRVRDRGAHLLWGLARDVGGRTAPTSLRRVVGVGVIRGWFGAWGGVYNLKSALKRGF